MAGDDQEKTEEPTDKKLEDARKQGDVPMSPEMRHAVMFIATLTMMGGVGLSSLMALARLFASLWGGADLFPAEAEGAQYLAGGIMTAVAKALLPLFTLLFAAAFLIPFLQGRPSLNWSRLSLKWSKLSPVAGMGRLFGKRALIEFAKTLLKSVIIVGVAWLVLEPRLVAIDTLIGADPIMISRVGGGLIRDMLQSIAILVGALALFDYVYQRRAFMKRMRMSLQEIRDEVKQSEGDPHIKSRIRAIRISRSRRRMMAAVPSANVIVTNPTHYAVALKYDQGQMAAPVVVAKGVDAIAMKIREAATGAGIPIVESPPLARALYASVDIDHPIPVEHYAAVAEIIGYVMRLNQRIRD